MYLSKVKKRSITTKWSKSQDPSCRKHIQNKNKRLSCVQLVTLFTSSYVMSLYVWNKWNSIKAFIRHLFFHWHCISMYSDWSKIFQIVCIIMCAFGHWTDTGVMSRSTRLRSLWDVTYIRQGQLLIVQDPEVNFVFVHQFIIAVRVS